MLLPYHNPIIERDKKCVLCPNLGDHVHHIKFRGSGGTDEYANLALLCAICHSTKAHGGNNENQWRDQLLDYTARFERPDNWDKVIKETELARKKERERQRKARHKRYVKQKEFYKSLK